MKTALILAYDFPPYVSVGGLRPYSWYQYLKEYDVYPVIITRQWSNTFGSELDYIAPGESDKTITEITDFGVILRTPYKPNISNRLLLKYGFHRFSFLRKIITAYFEFMQWGFPVGPKKNLYKAAKDYLEINSVDIIIATGDPFILFKYASQLSKKYKTPWIADYRDPWTNGAGLKRKKLLSFFLSFKEKSIVKTAVAVTSVSDFFIYKISKLIKMNKFFVLPNGYNPDFIDEIKTIKQSDTSFTIGFAGTISQYHPIDGFLNSLQQFIDETPNIRLSINFYGINIHDELKQLIDDKYKKVKPFVTIYPRLANNLALRELAKSNLLLLFNNYNFIGTKIYDYLALKRMILFCFEDDQDANKIKRKYFEYYSIKEEEINLQREILLQTHSGIIIKDKSHLISALQTLYSEFLINKSISCPSEKVDSFSRKVHTKKLSEIINIVLTRQ